MDTDDDNLDEPKRYPTAEERLARVERIVALCAKAVLDHRLIRSENAIEDLTAFWEDIAP